MDEERVHKLVRELIIELGEDPTREGLRETPRRIANMYKEIFSGYDSDSELSVQFSEDSDVVVAKDIQFYSMCEHHMLPFFGKVHIAYSPNGRVFGISKLVRLVEKFSKRLQIQERLTKNIADELHAQGVKGVVVVAEAEHLCMKMRGVKNDARMTTSAFRGIYENKDERESVVAMIRKRSSEQF
ncbi:GTP cyclohydrolase I FolE [Nitrosopumilus sp. b1]|uniref:GTP cyclohydrolase I FolE n=1 Tax=Nitrosopumilus sp. b1 TaxID=2109907 RepID=UPI000E2BD60A|nr:GTP cyclohydrolase I FolE [Nitrosopumilus sp. b1]RDJ32091.1 MAG: GTP cyclohydrolase I FolE [Thermoproteota archaeon]KAF6243608.1 GTP cyclohydrolase I FolE [Nitrosopumilus sp. b1]RDJ34651.1 MAG: GTP cyclohydrolase I FolE [Thermoproteota archaeon]RDJ34872.1 MAG: GTP cyclohydrolase I FolE [Thermoproteota archaeon]RDJ38718.1 MAG: GTP cyclohydrolase I FolE [Thermoproteota archaeon]